MHMKVLVICASGAVGAAVTTTLRDWGHDVTAAGRRPSRDGLVLNLAASDLRPFECAADEHDVVVNASGVENPAAAEATRNTPFIDVSANGPYLAALAERAPANSIILGSGLAPGLSTVLASSVTSCAGDALDVTVMLGSGEKHGTAAVAWTTRLIGTTITDGCDPEKPLNLRQHRWFGEPIRRRRYLRADFPDHILIGKPRNLQIRSWLALTSPTATRALEVMTYLPGSRWLIGRTPPFGRQDWSVAVTNRRTAQTCRASGIGQSHATAMVTALAVTTLLDNTPSRPVTLDKLLTTADLSRLPGIKLTPPNTPTAAPRRK